MVMRGAPNDSGYVVEDFATEEDAVTAIRALQAAGFRGDEISVIAQDRAAAEHVADDTGTEAPEGAAAGAVAGGALGAAAALIIGASAIAIPGLGIAIGAPIAGALAGAVGGGLVGGLIGLGIPEDEARQYEDRVREGRILVTVHAGDREQEVRSILQDVSTSGSGTAGVYGEPQGSTGNTVLDQGMETHTAGITPPIDTTVGHREGEGYTAVDDDPSLLGRRDTDGTKYESTTG
jgi:hypothetical protein